MLMLTASLSIALKPMDSFGTWRIFCFFLFCESPPPPPPKHFAIGYVHNDNLPQGNIALQYVIQNNYRKVWWCFLMISCTLKDQEKFGWIHLNYLVALIFCYAYFIFSLSLPNKN